MTYEEAWQLQKELGGRIIVVGSILGEDYPVPSSTSSFLVGNWDFDWEPPVDEPVVVVENELDSLA